MTDSPRYALCQLAFPDTTFSEDVEIAKASNAAGLSVLEDKIDGRDPKDVRAELEAAALQAACCIPSVMSFLPAPPFYGPDTVEERVAEMSEGIRKLAQLGPTGVLVMTGPNGDFTPAEARKRAADALVRIADLAHAEGVKVAFETFRFKDPQNLSFVFGLEEAVDFLDEAGRPDVELCYDIWQIWDRPRIIELTRELAPRINVVHLNDYREPTRAWEDRVLPGDGVAPLPEIVAALREGGYDGFYDLEVFSDDGRMGNDFPDSVWKLPWLEQAQRGYAGLMKAWEASFALDAAR